MIKITIIKSTMLLVTIIILSRYDFNTNKTYLISDCDNTEACFSFNEKTNIKYMSNYEVSLIPGITDKIATQINKNMSQNLEENDFEHIKGVGKVKNKVLKEYLSF